MLSEFFYFKIFQFFLEFFYNTLFSHEETFKRSLELLVGRLWIFYLILVFLNITILNVGHRRIIYLFQTRAKKKPLAERGAFSKEFSGSKEINPF